MVVCLPFISEMCLGATCIEYTSPKFSAKRQLRKACDNAESPLGSSSVTEFASCAKDGAGLRRVHQAHMAK